MSAPVPKKVSQVVQEEIAAIITSLPSYLEEADVRILDWRDRLEQGIDGSGVRSAAFLELGTVAHLTGDIELAERYFARALSAGCPAIEVWVKQLSTYVNLGFASLAQNAARSIYDRSNGLLGGTLGTVAASGDFHHLGQLFDLLKRLNVNISNVPQCRKLLALVEAAGSLGVDSTDFGKVLDISGAVLREQRLFWLGAEPRFSFDPEMNCIGIRYRIGTTPKRATELTSEFTRRLLETQLTAVPISIRFLGTLPEQEESAEPR